MTANVSTILFAGCRKIDIDVWVSDHERLQHLNVTRYLFPSTRLASGLLDPIRDELIAATLLFLVQEFLASRWRVSDKR